MIIDPLISLMLIVRDLLSHDEELILKGRANEEQILSSTNYIAVDALAPAQPLSRSDNYDGEAEVATYAQSYRQPVTVDFYGDDAATNATRFSVLLGSYLARDLQVKYGIRAGAVTGVTDLKNLTGQQYGNRLQVELVIHYTQTVNVDLMRIDSAPIEVIS